MLGEENMPPGCTADVTAPHITGQDAVFGD